MSVPQYYSYRLPARPYSRPLIRLLHNEEFELMHYRVFAAFFLQPLRPKGPRFALATAGVGRLRSGGAWHWRALVRSGSRARPNQHRLEINWRG